MIGKNPLDEKKPWLTFNAIDFITANTPKTGRVFEYGGGGSTLYFLDHASEVVTVEHDQQWFHFLEKKINAQDSKRWCGNLVLPEELTSAVQLDEAEPEHYYSADRNFKNATFKLYSTFICRYDDEYFDIVLIDGRARTSCLHHAMLKVKIGGYLVLDNAERKYYLQENKAKLDERFELLIDQPGPVPYSPQFSKTAIWKRLR